MAGSSVASAMPRIRQIALGLWMLTPCCYLPEVVRLSLSVPTAALVMPGAGVVASAALVYFFFEFQLLESTARGFVG